MHRFALACLARQSLVFMTFVAMSACPHFTLAEESNIPSAKIAVRSCNDVFRIVDVLMNLTGGVERIQAKVVKDFIDTFLVGVDKRRPVCVDIILHGNRLSPAWHIPISNFKRFREAQPVFDNLLCFQRERFLYELKSAGFNGWMRRAADHVSITEGKDDLPDRDPSAEILNLFQPNSEFAFGIRNARTDFAAQCERRSAFREVRSRLLAAIPKKQVENDEQYALKKEYFELALDEAEWLFVESQKFAMQYQTDREKHQGLVNFEFVPIAGTTLDSQVRVIGSALSDFANIEQAANSILSLRLTYPLDRERAQPFATLSNTLRASANAAIEDDLELSPSERQSTKRIAEVAFNLLDAGIEDGLFDGFVEVRSTPAGKNTLICGVHTIDGTVATDVVKHFPASRKGREATIDTDSQGDVKIHSVKLAPNDLPYFQRFFGASTVYVGTSKDVVWCAAGENALPELKATIKTRVSVAPAASPVFAKLYVKLRPWIKLRQDVDPDPENAKLRNLAIEAFEQGADIVRGEFRQEGAKILGNFVFETGILRFAGKAIADFSKDNLQ